MEMVSALLAICEGLDGFSSQRVINADLFYVGFVIRLSKLLNKQLKEPVLNLLDLCFDFII